ncbi:hypothetical protein ACOBV9_18355 (plasmid) [Pseudoalteromonas espejiana]
MAEFALLSDALDNATGQPQATSNIKQTLEVSLAAVNHLAADKLAAAEQAQIALDAIDESAQSDEESSLMLQPLKSK